MGWVFVVWGEVARYFPLFRVGVKYGWGLVFKKTWRPMCKMKTVKKQTSCRKNRWKWVVFFFAGVEYWEDHCC